MQQLSYYTLQALARWLQPRLAGAVLTHAFSQDKDELVLRFSTTDKALYLRVGCGQHLQYLVPQSGFKRAAKNTVALFRALRGSVVQGLRQLAYERVIVLDFVGGHQLVLKLHGKRANVIWILDGKVQALFRKQQKDDLAYVPQDLALPLPQNAQELDAQLAALHTDHTGIRSLYPHLDKVCVQQLQSRLDVGQPLWPALQALFAQLETASSFYVVEKDFILFDAPAARVYTDIATALQAWLRAALGQGKLQHVLEQLHKRTANVLTKAQAKLASVQHSLHTRQHQRSAEELGHLLMANLHAIQPQSKVVLVDDLYLGGQVSIALNPQLNPQQNAEAYYAQHRTLQAEILQLQGQLAECSTRLATAQAANAALASATDVKSIKQVLASHSILRSTTNTATKDGDQPKPYRSFTYQGYAIWVGRDATSNDALTLHHARKNDLWLHAKDVTGSHVVLRQKDKQPFPKPVIEYAAGLAAYYSKLRNQTLAAVSYTPRKYVRKGRGMAPGAVRLEREETMLVAPIRPQQATD